MASSRERRVRDAARSFRTKWGLGNDRVDPFEALRLVGAEVVRFPLNDAPTVDGIYRVVDGRVFVLVNTANKPIERQRFTGAHELGHHELDGTDESEIVDVNVDRPADARHAEMNTFAAAFLIDEFGAKELYRAGMRGDALVANVMARFGVSLPAAAFELKNLGLLPIADCDDLLRRKESSSFRVKGFLRQHGFEIETNDAWQRELDPEFVGVTIRRYERGSLNDVALAAALRTDVDSLAWILAERGAAVRAPAPRSDEIELSPFLEDDFEESETTSPRIGAAR